MKITVFAPKKEFTEEQQNQLSRLGKVVYVNNRSEQPIASLIKLATKSNIVGLDPDVFGGFNVAKDKVTKLLETLPELAGIALSSSYISWIDVEYCQKRKIPLTNTPFFCTEAKAEDTIAMILNLTKKITISDRRIQKGEFKLEVGTEIKGKILGIIGLGHIGCRVAEMARGLGMKVVGWNRTQKNIDGIRMVSINKLLKISDVISIHLESVPETQGFLSSARLRLIKKGAVIVDTTGPGTAGGLQFIDQEAMASALIKNKIAAFTYEDDTIKKGPLAEVENAIGLLSFGWYTKESMARATNLWTKNIISLAKGKPLNPVN